MKANRTASKKQSKAATGNNRRVAKPRGSASRKQAEEILQEREKQLTFIYDTVADAIFTLEVEDGRFRFASVNEAFLSIKGLQRDQIVGKRVDAVIPEPSLSMVLGKYREAIRTKGTVRWEETSEYPTGKLTGEVSVAPVFDAAGNCTHLVGAVHDITQRKLAEEDVRQYADIVGNMQIGLYVFHLEDRGDDRTLRLVSANPAALQVSGVAEEEVVGHTLDESFPDLREMGIPQKYAEVIRSQKAAEIEVTYYDDAQQLDTVYAVKAFPLPNDHLGVAFENVTERRRAELELNRSHSLLNATLESTADGVLVVDLHGKITGHNRKFLELWRIPDELASKGEDRILLDYVLNQLQDPSAFLAKVEALYQSPNAVSFDELEFRDGRVFERYSQPQRMGEDILGRVWSFRDITERKQAEQSLQESEERFRKLFENSPLAIWEEDFSKVKTLLDDLKNKGAADLNAHLDAHPEIVSESIRLVRVLNVNQAALKLYEAENKSDLLGHLDKTFPEEALAGYKNELLLIARGGREFHSESTVNTHQGRHRDVSLHWAVAPGSEHDYSKVLVSLIDITERKQAEEKLRENEKRFRALIENGLDFISLLDAQGNLLWESPSSSSLLGYRFNEFIGQNLFDLIHPDDLEWTRQRFAELSGQPGARVSGSFRLRAADGGWRWVEANASNFLHQPGVNAIVINYRDITERKEAEDALRESEQRYSLATRATNDVIWEWNLQTDELFWNDNAYSVFGFAPDEVFPYESWWEDHIHPEDRGRVLSKINTTLASRETLWNDEYRFLRRDGSFAYIVDRGYLERDAEGNGLRMIGAMSDITTRRQAEESLRDREQRLNAIIQNEPECIKLLAADGSLLQMNPAGLAMIEADSLQSVLGKSVYSIVAPEHRQAFEQLTQQVFRGESGKLEFEIVGLKGTHRWLDTHAVPMRSEQGEVIALLGITRDVTERRRAEEALRESERRYRAVFENTPVAIWEEDYSQVKRRVEALKKQGVTDLRAYFKSNPAALRECMDSIRILDVNEMAVQMYEAGSKQELIRSADEEPGKGEFEHNLEDFALIAGGITHREWEGEDETLKGRPITIRLTWSVVPGHEADYSKVLVTTIDITERKKAERELQLSEERFRLLAGNIREVFWITDPVAKKDVYLSPAYEEVWGVSLEDQLQNRNLFLESVLAEDRRMVMETIEKQLQGSKTEMEYRIRRPDGSIRWIWDRAFPILDESQNVELVTGIAADITERKQAEAETLRHLDELQALYENGLAVGRLVSPREIGDRVIQTFTRYLSWHHVTIRLRKGASDDLELIAFSVPHLKEEDKESVARNFTMRVGKVGQGMSGWVVQTGKLIRTGNVHDYPQYVDTYERIQSGMYMPLQVGDQIIGSISVESELADAFTLQDERLLATLGTQAAVAFENARLYQAIQQELGERRRAEELLEQERNSLANRVEERTAELISANSNLARALRVKDEFLANMSHELRTPLNAILGLSESLGEQVAGALNEKQQKYVQTITESGHHLLALINDILDLAKIEAGQVTLDISKVDVRTLCQSSLRMVKQMAQKKNQEVSLEIDENFGLLWADERRLKQMIVNLLSNAVKFTPQDGKLGLEVHGDKNENRVLITVWDRGVGIAEEDIAKLFQPFVQLSTGLARESTGTGLGLTLVAQMARLHGGGVSVSSSPGEGSRFTLVLPWEPALAPDTVERMKITGKFRAVRTIHENERRTILLIEDTPDVVMMVRDYLESAGYNVAVAEDGLEGIAQAKRVRPDLILMDLQMPRMDGFEATRKLRSDPDFKTTPIIALTALAMQGDRERCLAAGMDEYITKPVNLKGLVKIVEACLTQPDKEQPAVQ